MKPMTCAACNCQLVKVKTGLVCPNGHGKIFPCGGRIRPDYPLATKIPGTDTPYRYTIEGVSGVFRKYSSWLVGSVRGLCEHTTPGPITRARLAGKATKFVPYEGEKE
jgi:hypothetical protein